MEKKSNKGILLALFVTVFVDMLGIGIVIPVFPLLFADPDAGIFSPGVTQETRYLLYGLLAAAFPLAQFFGAPFLGALADRHGRKPILAISLFGTLIGYALFAWSVMEGNLWLMFFSRALDGFTGGNISIAMSSIADISDESNKTKNFGLIGMAFGIGFVLGPYIGGKLADPSVYSGFGYSTPFIGAAVLSAINLVLVWLVYRETLKVKQRTPISFSSGFRNVGRAFASPRLRTIFIVMFLLTFGFTFFTQFFQIFLSEKFAYTPSQVGDIFAYVGIWIALTQGGLTRVFKRFTPQQIMNVCIFLLSAMFIFLVLPDQNKWLYFILPFIAIAQGLITPNASNLVSSQAGPEAQGEILGINQSVQSLAQAIPPIVAGVIVSIRMELPILVAAACTFAAGGIFVFFFRRSQPRTVHVE